MCMGLDVRTCVYHYARMTMQYNSVNCVLRMSCNGACVYVCVHMFCINFICVCCGCVYSSTYTYMYYIMSSVFVCVITK